MCLALIFARGLNPVRDLILVEISVSPSPTSAPQGAQRYRKPLQATNIKSLTGFFAIQRRKDTKHIYLASLRKPIRYLFFYNLAILLFFFGSFFYKIQAQNEPQRYEFEHPQMGTTFRFVVYAQDDSTVIKAFLSAKKEIDRLNQMMSDYLPESELNLLSRSSGTDTWIKVSDELWEIMALSKKIAKKSKGDFDPTIGPLSRLWRRAIRRQEVPDPAKINEALSQVGYRLIKMNTSRKEILLKEKNMKLDLGGIAKGYAVDAAFEVFQHFGLKTVLVDGGGDLRLGDPPKGQKGWKVEVSGLDNEGKTYEKRVELSNCAIATSGAKYKYVEANGQKYSHIIDPKTGMGIIERRLVTVIAPTCTLADALASLVSVSGFEKGEKTARKIMGKQEFSISLAKPENQEFNTYYYHHQ